MPEYLSPGVYVEEVPSAVKPIAGVGTSTAGFVGVVPDTIYIPLWAPIEVIGEQIQTEDGEEKAFNLQHYPVQTAPESFTIKVGEDVQKDAELSNDDKNKVSQVTFKTAPQKGASITGDYVALPTFEPVPAQEVKLCTNFSEFKSYFGDFSADTGQNRLAHAVYGFFNNGGTRCYVMRVAKEKDITAELLKETFAPIDEIALVAMPGVTDKGVQEAILAHCEDTHLQDRFAILDCAEKVEDTQGNLDLTKLGPSKPDNGLPRNSNYAALYFPWLQVFDPAQKTIYPGGDGLVYVPPSGHIAGIYARVDSQRGVHKAPANEVVRGALGVKYRISKAQQDGLNPQGVNCIRPFDGNVTVWGARTWANPDKEPEWKYVNVRRLFLFLRESIDKGTQWVVFEPNTPALWAKITRNVTAFLTNVWQAGALFGDTPEQAFYVKCDEETNPPAVRDLGQVVTEVGVAVVKPAEFVIFRISQWAGPGG